MIDDKDAKKLKGKNIHLSGDNYPYFYSNGRKVKVYRYIMNAPKGKIVDHINRNKLDNRRVNLRLCTPQQNNWNSKAKRGKVFKGVSPTHNGKFRVRIMKNGVSHYLGVFNSAIEGAKEYNRMAKKLFGRFAYINKFNEDLLRAF